MTRNVLDVIRYRLHSIWAHRVRREPRQFCKCLHPRYLKRLLAEDLRAIPVIKLDDRYVLKKEQHAAED